MSNEIINAIFDAYGTDGFEGFSIMKSQTEDEEALGEYLDNTIPEDTRAIFEDLKNGVRHERDKQIFIDGFRIAFKLCAEVYSHE